MRARGEPFPQPRRRRGAASARAMPTAAKPSSARLGLARFSSRCHSFGLPLLAILPRVTQPALTAQAGRGTSKWAPLCHRGARAGQAFDGIAAVDGIDLAVPEGAIYGVLGPNGAGKTTTLRMLLGIIDPDEGARRCSATTGRATSPGIGYLPEERGLYPSMKAARRSPSWARCAGCRSRIGRKRGRELMESNGLGYMPPSQIRQLSKGMAQPVQLLGTLVHEPKLVVLDEPFSGLDAVNQGKLESLIRGEAANGPTVSSRPTSSPMPSGCASGWRSSPAARCRSRARSTSPATASARRSGWRRAHADGPWRAALPADARARTALWHFPLPEAASSRCCAP